MKPTPEKKRRLPLVEHGPPRAGLNASGAGFTERERAAKELREALDTRLLAALAEPARVGILEFLFLQGPSDVTAIAGPQPQERSVVSRHLRLLHEAGLVRVTRDGRRRIYELDGAGLLDRLDTMVARARRMVSLCCPPAPALR